MLIEDPAWSSLRLLLRNKGIAYTAIPVDSAGIIPDILAERCARGAYKAIFCTPRAQNPTGATITPRRRSELIDTLARHPEMAVIEDDHLFDLTAGPYLTLTQGRAHFAVIRSFSKVLNPDLRVAMVSSDRELANQVQLQQLLGPGWVSHLVQDLVARSMMHEEYPHKMLHAKEIYDSRRERLIAGLGFRGVHSSGAAGLNVYIPVSDEGRVAADLAEHGWNVCTGEAYRTNSEPFIRVCIASLTDPQIDSLANAISQAMSSQSAGRY